MAGGNVHVGFLTDNPAKTREALGSALLEAAYSR
jgi:hypothetical protein